MIHCKWSIRYSFAHFIHFIIVLTIRRSQNSYIEENTLDTSIYGEMAPETLLRSAVGPNPFRRFLSGEPFSIQSNMNMERSIADYLPILNAPNSRGSQRREDYYVDNQEDEQQLSETLCEDDDMPSSSGCSSASSTSGGDDSTENLVTKVTKAVETAAEKKFDRKIIEKEYTDDFDNVTDAGLEKLPDGLREVIAEMRESTNADIRQRNKESRISMMLAAEENRNRRKAELRAQLLGLDSPGISNGSSNSLVSQPVVEISTQLKFYPWQLKNKLLRKDPVQPVQSESKPNILVIDNTNVTLRKKGTSQINEEENQNSRTENQPVDTEPSKTEQVSNETGDATVDDLREFNTHNYWYISPSYIDIEKELSLLKSPEQPPQGNV